MPVAFAIGLAAALPPAGLVALPGGLAILGTPQTAVVLLAALLFVPALVAVTVALQGFEAVVGRFRRLTDHEAFQIVARVLLNGLAFAYLIGATVLSPTVAGAARAVPVAALNLASGWLFLLGAILDPRASALRRWVASVSDAALLSILLAAGDLPAAPLALLYPYIAISNGRVGDWRRLTAVVALGACGFALVVSAAPFWQANPLMAAGILIAMTALPAYVGMLLRRFAGAAREAERANTAKNRFLAALGEDLRTPLRSLARLGATGEPGPSEAARIRVLARAMLLQLDDVLNYVKIDSGTFAPEARSFDVYRLVNGLVASLRPTAGERGIALALRIDPLLPFLLRGWPNEVRQIFSCLVTNTICHASAGSKVHIELDAAAAEAERVTVGFKVTTSELDNRLDNEDDPPEVAIGRHLALSVAERMAGLMGGCVEMQAGAGGLVLRAELPFAIDQTAARPPLDLAQLPVLIVTGDADLVGELFEPFEAWRASPRWIGAAAAAHDYLAAMPPPARRPVIVLDGRGDILPALNWAHRALSLTPASRPQILFVVDEARIDSVVGLAADEIDGILPAPFNLDGLRGALHALWLEPEDWFLASAADEESQPPAVAARARPPAEIEDMAAPPLPAGAFAAGPGPAGTAPRRREVLVATGNTANRKLMASLLERAGHSVHLADSTAASLRIVSTQEIDLLLLDLTSSSEADWEAARRCRRTRPRTSIVALSNDPPATARRLARDIGIDAILTKPVEPKRLLAAIDAVFGGGAAVTQLAAHRRRGAGSPAKRSEPAELPSVDQDQGV
ncbi:MAG: response regulator [Alphaproteobacteria bacterium]|nr:response regulator [Alphaproteobacteria bacterium]